jgi:hypothetical protein
VPELRGDETGQLEHRTVETNGIRAECVTGLSPAKAFLLLDGQSTREYPISKLLCDDEHLDVLLAIAGGLSRPSLSKYLSAAAALRVKAGR